MDIHINILVVSGASRILPGGPDRSIVEDLIDSGVEVYAYLHDNSNGSVPVGLGELYNTTIVHGDWNDTDYINYVKSLIDQYVGKVTGVFLDECDPGYFGTTDPEDPHLINFKLTLVMILWRLWSMLTV